jgi:hypothetical protein
MTTGDPDSTEQHTTEAAALHPEEMRTTLDMAIDKFVSVRATARATRAGLVDAALLVAAICVPMVLLSRSRARRVFP